MVEKVFCEKLKQIDKIIQNDYKKEDTIGVFEGLSGISLFHFYYNRYLDRNDNNTAEEIIEKCVDFINKGSNSASFSQGISGFGWVLDLLKTEEFIDFDNDSFLSQFDFYIEKEMDSYLRKGYFDFLHGAIGCAYYFLKRYKSTTSEELKKRYKNYLFLFIENLKKISIQHDEGKVKWLSYSQDNDKQYNLSLSHGITGVVAILSKLHEVEDFKAPTKKILLESLNYILSFESTDKDTHAIFPNMESDNTHANGRIAWCYGDLGIGLTILNASKSLNNDKMREKALKILKHSASRITPETSFAVDPYICHGAFGNSHIFHKIYKETRYPEFKEARNLWIDIGLEMIASKSAFIENKKGINHLSFLNGVAGIGLVMISYLANDKSTWDECLMIN